MISKFALAFCLPFLLIPASDDRQEAVLGLITRDYKKAIPLLETELGKREANPDEAIDKGADRVRFLLANARLMSGDRAGAQRGFGELARRYPQSSYVTLARYGLAKSLQQQKQFQDAAKIYRSEVGRLLSSERRVRLAETYLELVNKRLKQEPPDRKGAIRFIDLALALELPRENDLGLRRRAATLAYEAKDYKQAAQRFERLVVRLRGKVRGEGAAEGEAANAERLWLAKAWRRIGRGGEARLLLEDLLRGTLDAKQAPEAMLELALTFGLPRRSSSTQRGIDVLTTFLQKHANDERAPRAAYLRSQSLAALGRVEKALAAADELLEKYGDRGVDELAQASADRGLYLGRLERFDDAVKAWKDYLARFPSHPRWMDAQRAIVDLELAKADSLRNKALTGIAQSGDSPTKAELNEAEQKQLTQAALLYRRFLQLRPLDARSRRIYLTLGAMDVVRGRWDDAKRNYERAVKKYPRTNEASEAAYRIGRLLETQLFDYSAAVAAYRDVKGAWRGRAQQRLRVLRDKSLLLWTERTFTTAEKPRVKIRSRNIEKLRLRVYKLDISTFFRGTLGRGNVDSLAVEVISPDADSEDKVADYVKYKETEREVSLPFSDAGAYVVKVDDGEFEATSLVLVSDLAILTKASRKQLFCFAQNTRENRAEPGADIIVTDGAKVLAEGKTDERGAFRLEGEKIERAQQLHVFAKSGGGNCATTLTLRGLSVGRGLQPKAFLYTDRSAYRPGERVAAKAVLRDVERGVYVLPKDAAHHLDFLDGAGRLLQSRKLDAGGFGTLHASFSVPGTAATGNFSLRLRRASDEKVVATARVLVADFQPPRVSLSLESDRKILVRGERIEGKVSASYFFGGAVVGKRVEVVTHIDGRRVLRGKTDAAGEFAFSFATTALDSGAAIAVQVTMPEEQATAHETFLIRDTAFQVQLDDPGKVFVAGDDVEIAARVSSHRGDPLARKLEFALYRLESDRRRGLQEIPVAKHGVTSDAKSGRAFQRFVLANGGRHRVRVSATDRLGKTILAARDFFVSGKEDQVKLRVLCQAQRGEVGQTVELRVINRVGPKLCLVTTEGDGVLAFEARSFPKGESKVSLPLGELHAPNFRWALSMIDGKELRQANKAFVVTRPLRVVLKGIDGRRKPGEEVDVELEVRDGRNKPVAAELSLALVDQAVLDLFPDRSAKLEDVFYGTSIRRSLELRTASSCTFNHRAHTQRVNQALKAEEQRRMREDAEKRERDRWAAAGDEIARADKPRASAGRTIRRVADRLRTLEGRAGRPAQEAQEELESAFESIGVGGGAGGQFGGRRGGRARRKNKGMADEKAKNFAGKRGFFYEDGLDGDFRARSQNFYSSLALSRAPKMAGAPADKQHEGGAEARNLSDSATVWRAAIVSDAKGIAKLRLPLPRSEGKWSVRVRGVGKASLFGEAKASLVTAKEVLVRPALPRTLVEGDRAKLRVSMHNLGDAERSLDWKVESNGERVDAGSLRVGAQRSSERHVEFVGAKVGRSELSFSAKAGEASDAVRASVEVMPWAVERRAGHSGVLTADESMRVELPKGEYRSRTLRIEIGPRDLNDLLPARPLVRRARLSNCSPSWVAPTLANQAAAGLTALTLLEASAASKAGESARIASLRARIESTLASLQALESGGRLRWIGKRGANDDHGTMLAWRFFVRARARGFAVDSGVLARMAGQLRNWLRSRNLDFATHAYLVAAEAKRGDFARFNTLYRSRTRMSLAAKARLALAAHAMGRPGLAVDLERAIADSLRAPMTRGRIAGQRKIVDDERLIESRLWGLLALSKNRQHETLLAAGARWLWSQRRPYGWRNALVTALAVEFAAGRKRVELTQRVEVEVNGKWRKVVDFAKAPEAQVLEVPADQLAAGVNTVRMRPQGRGSAAWSVLLSGITTGIPEDLAKDKILRRRYLQPAAVLEGKVLPEGFTTVDSRLKRWTNEASEVPVGGSVRVSLRYSPTSEMQERQGSYVVEEPLPAGTTVLEREIRGNHDHVEVASGFLRFFVHESKKAFFADYTLRGFVPGQYRVLPTRVWSLVEPDFEAFGKSNALRVLPSGAAAKDVRKPTPDELYARGLRSFDAIATRELETKVAERDQAEAWLRELYEKYGEHLQPAAFREVARRLLRVALVKGASQRIVALFEALKDRDENYVLGFEDMYRVGDAYYKSGEFERSLVVYEAIAETSFLREVQIAGTLDSIGEVRASVAFMQSLFLTFPGVPTVRGAMYSLAQSLNKRAAAIAPGARIDPKVGTRVELKRQARDLCYEFLLRHPEDADADEVLFTLASVALEAEQLEEGIALLGRARKAWAKSPWLDDFLYLEGYARFLRGESKEALELLARVANEKFPNERGRLLESESRWLAIFLRGQIHHASGRPDLALAEYRKVEKRFADAREAADYFRTKRLAVQEVSIVAPKGKAKLSIKHRNLPNVALTVYKVDLMRLYLMRKSLTDMGSVQLFGIAPVHEQTLELGKFAAYRDHETEVELPLEAGGAYLVLARNGELKSSGLLLKSDVRIEAQELAGQGRLRVNVKRDGVFVPKAVVKVVGDRDGKIRTGRTDLRGIYVADGIQGKATVLAKAGDSYAFYRGKVHFGGVPQQQRRGKKSKLQEMRKQLDLLKDNELRNFRNQNKQTERLQQLFKNRQRGVEIRRTK